MKKFTLLLFTACLIGITSNIHAQSGCVFEENNTNIIATCDSKEPEKMMLIGLVEPQTLANETWYAENYNNYDVDIDTLTKLKNLNTPTEISVIIGTWCPDCHRETPRFIKIIENLNNPHISVKYIAVDRNKTDPQGLASAYEFSRIPTFIVSQNNQEKGRIVEKPTVSLEKDILSILN